VNKFKIFFFLLLDTSLVAAAGELTTDNCYEIREYLRYSPVLKPYLFDKQLLDALTKLLILHTQCIHFTQKIQTYR
jgi:hypothetical protein